MPASLFEKNVVGNLLHELIVYEHFYLHTELGFGPPTQAGRMCILNLIGVLLHLVGY